MELKKGDIVKIIDKYSSHFEEFGEFGGMVDDIDGEKADRPYIIIFNYEGKDLIRFYRKIDIEKIEQTNKVKNFGQFSGVSKREKIFLNGYEMWLDRDKLMLYDKEKSQHGIGFDVASNDDGIYVFSQHLTKDEKRQITDYMKYRTPNNS